MKKLFNKSFFRFTIGFIIIITTSFLIISAIGYYQNTSKADTTATVEGN